MSSYLGLDASTQSISALVFDADSGRVVAESSVNFGQDLPAYKAPQGFIPGGSGGEVHSDPRMWLAGLDLCLERLKEVFPDFSKIAAISGAGQQHGTVYLNADGLSRLNNLDASESLEVQFAGGFSRPTSPIWMDTSTSAECREIEAAVGGSAVVCEKSGSVAVERFSGPQIRRFSKSNPEAYAETVRVHLVSSFFASVLSGSDAPIDTGDGAGMNLLNLEALGWDEDLCRATAPDLISKLPFVVEGGTVLGSVAGYFVEKFGFEPTAKVTVFTGDNPSSLVGMGGATPGKVIISLGTSDTFFAAMPKPLTDPKGCGHVFGNPLGGFMTLQCFLNGSLAREKVRDALGMSWDDFSNAVLGTKPGNSGKRMLPFFGPEISPRLNLSEPKVEGFQSSDWSKDTDSVRACLEGQFLNMRLASEWMRLAPKVIYLTGGASQNDTIAQVVADIFEATVKRMDVSSSVALGGAFRAALATGGMSLAAMDQFFQQAEEGISIQPNPGVKVTYQEALEDIRRLLRDLTS